MNLKFAKMLSALIGMITPGIVLAATTCCVIGAACCTGDMPCCP